MGSFIFRTTSFNSIRTLAARLQYFAAVSGNLLACLPLELKLRGKSTTQSYRPGIYYIDLSVRRSFCFDITAMSRTWVGILRLQSKKSQQRTKRSKASEASGIILCAEVG